MSMIAEDTFMCDREWGHTEFEPKALRNLLGCYPTGGRGCDHTCSGWP